MRNGIRVLAAAAAVAVATVGGSQEYRIDRPTEPASAPVHLTRPVEGRVEVTNLPPVQEVRVSGGQMDGPMEVQGEVGVRASAPIPVEVVNAPEAPEAFQVRGVVRVDDSPALRVWVENQPEARPARPPQARRFAAYSFRGAFDPDDTRLRKPFRVPQGATFHLTDLTVDTRADAVLRVRLTAPASAVGGSVAGASGDAELPLAVVDVQMGPAARLGTPVPLTGEFHLEVEAPGPGLGAPFWTVASGYLETGAPPAGGP
ncbi:MAG: hypothetical protein Kow0092_16160 [Deferrisomatales bacterium]